MMKKNTQMYQKYKELAEKEEKDNFRRQLGEYKYYDMDGSNCICITESI